MVRTFNAAALLQKERLDSKKNEGLLKAHHQSSFRSDILSRYSSDGRALNHKDAAKWLAALTTDGNISDDELRWVLMLGNMHSKSQFRFQGSSKELDLKSAVIFPDTLELVVQAWVSYVKNKPSIESIFKQFDVDRNGSLSRGEVANFLTSLNNGVSPTAEEVEELFQASDVIGTDEGIETPEIMQLLSTWYSRHSKETQDEKNTNDVCEVGKNNVAAVSPNQVCGQCILQ